MDNTFESNIKPILWNYYYNMININTNIITFKKDVNKMLFTNFFYIFDSSLFIILLIIFIFILYFYIYTLLYYYYYQLLFYMLFNNDKI